MDGGGIELVRKADDTGWVARRADAQLEVRDVGGGVFKTYDGKWLAIFLQLESSRRQPAAGQRQSLLLQDVFGKGGTHVHLAYTIGYANACRQRHEGLSIDLASVSYNYDSSGRVRQASGQSGL